MIINVNLMNSLNSHSRKDQIVITIPTDEFAASFFKIIDKKLDNSYVFTRQTEGSILKFKGSIFRFVWNGWNVFNSISGGEIEFDEENGNPFIRHKIYFTELFIIALLFNLIPLFTLHFEPKFSLYIFLGIWLLYYINFFVTIFRFNSYITEILIRVNSEHGYRFKTDIPAFG
jgi:hypothetical protein